MYFQNGIQLEKSRKFEEASVEFVMAYAEDPSLTNIYRELGNCAYFKDKGTALDYYGCYLHFHPEDSRIKGFRDSMLKPSGHKGPPVIGTMAPPPEGGRPTPAAVISVNWEKDLEEAKKKAAGQKKAILFFNWDRCDEELVEDMTGQYVQKKLLKELFANPRYSEWIGRTFVPFETRSHIGCWNALNDLNQGGGKLDRLTTRMLILARSDFKDWRSVDGNGGGVGSMLFLIESLKQFRDPLAKPFQEVAVCKSPSFEGGGELRFSTYRIWPYQAYLADAATGPFMKVPGGPFESPVLIIRGLRAGKEYFLQARDIGVGGNEELACETFGWAAHP